MIRCENTIVAEQVNASLNAGRSLEDLPPPNITRWGIRRKAAVVKAIESQVLSFDEACARYDLSAEELETWMRRLSTHGVGGLRVTRLSDYRAQERSESKI